MPVGNGGGADSQIGGKRRLAGRQHLPRCLDLDKIDSRRRGQDDRAADKRDPCALAGQFGGNGVALFT